MGEIISLYDAIIKTKVKEDQCTYFLFWLLQKLPFKIFYELIGISGLSLKTEKQYFTFEVQYPLHSSRPDAVINLEDYEYIIVETKRLADAFDENQFINHIEGGIAEFGKGNPKFLFLSGDNEPPENLGAIGRKYQVQIGVLSWKKIIDIFQQYKREMEGQFEILINEFLIFANHYRLGRVMSITQEELKKFIELYPITVKYKEPASETLNSFMQNLMSQVILESEERIEENPDDLVSELPALYRSFHISDWPGGKGYGFIFLNLMTETTGVLISGYQDQKELKKFIPLWNDIFKTKYKENGRLSGFTWIEEDEDDLAIDSGYFKAINGTSGKIFNPTKISDFASYFYWGYQYDFQLDKIKELSEKIPKDLNELVKSFSE
jgi:hypothetical protein